MRRVILTAVASALVALTASQAQAETVVINGFTFNPASSLNVSVPSYSGQAGQFTGTLDSNSFVTYCTDLSQELSFGVPMTYSVVDGVTAWGATKSADLDRALSAFAAAGYPSNAATSAAAQAIVWEILFETGPSYDFNAGSFQATSPYAPTQSALNSINWPGLPFEPITLHADQLYSREHQDLLVITQVPEPSTYALMFAGLAGIGFVARRRSRNQG